MTPFEKAAGLAKLRAGLDAAVKNRVPKSVGDYLRVDLGKAGRAVWDEGRYAKRMALNEPYPGGYSKQLYQALGPKNQGRVLRAIKANHEGRGVLQRAGRRLGFKNPNLHQDKAMSEAMRAVKFDAAVGWPSSAALAAMMGTGLTSVPLGLMPIIAPIPTTLTSINQWTKILKAAKATNTADGMRAYNRGHAKKLLKGVGAGVLGTGAAVGAGSLGLKALRKNRE